MEPKFSVNMISAGESSAEASPPLKPSNPQLHKSSLIIWYLLVHIWLRDPRCESPPQQTPDLSVSSSKLNPEVLGFVPVSWRKKQPLNFSLRTSPEKKHLWCRTGICQIFVGDFGGLLNPDRVLGSFVHCEVTRLHRMGMKVEPPHERILSPTPV